MNTIVTAYSGTNTVLFPNALSLYAEPKSNILDMTWGKGTFWKGVNQENYNLVRNDIDPFRGDIHQDFRCMDFENDGFDVIVFDPPYASRSSNKKSMVGSQYNNNKHQLNTVADMIAFYYDGMKEAQRLLKPTGILFVKCMDEVASGKQVRNHITIWNKALEMGFLDEDLFILVNPKTPIMRHSYQFHARKNNSFLWVFRN